MELDFPDLTALFVGTLKLSPEPSNADALNHGAVWDTGERFDHPAPEYR